jgi:hypothetical protein
MKPGILFLLAALISPSWADDSSRMPLLPPSAYPPSDLPISTTPVSGPVSDPYSAPLSTAPFPLGLPPMAPNPAFEPLSPLTPAPPGGEELSPSRHQVRQDRYPSGETMAERQFYDGKLDGLTKEYYKNGQIMNEWNYVLGNLHGESRTYYRSGDLKTEWNYKKGRLHGEVHHYFPRKLLKAVESYKEGKLVRRKAWDETGKRLPDDPIP